jgi:hypothetical protein
MKNKYKEIEFVCANSNYPDSTNVHSQRMLYEDLKKYQKDSDNSIFPYMQDFSDDGHKETSLSVVILKKDSEKDIEQKIMTLANKHNVEFDLYNFLNDKQVDDLIKGMIDNKM